jgi:septal ring factor EnvC (AmiA/AmiB activator)
MTETVIGLVSAVGVVAVEKIAEFAAARVSHREQRQDKQEDKNDETLEEIKEIKDEIKKLNKKIDDNKAEESRIRILRFYDEMTQGVHHSRDHFEQIIRDIDVYRAYCDSHTDFKNGIGEHAMNNIRKVYDEKM